jgi:osmotically-inducible protein OsmY
MIGTLSRWRIAVLLAAVVLLPAGCDTHRDAVNAQQLKIASAAVAAKGDAEPPGTDQAVEDSSLTTMVRAAIFADPELQTQHIKVITEDAAVTLKGHVDSPSLRDRAIRIASLVDGVAQVQDRLKVRG